MTDAKPPRLILPDSKAHCIFWPLFLGGLGLAAFIWAVRTGQFEDMDGAAQRILIDDEDEPN